MTTPGPGSPAVRIAASILSADLAHLADAVHAAERGGAEMIHVDVMDGCFVPPITMGPIVVEALRRVTSLPLDVHLMVCQPERHLEAFARAGATSLAVHPEATAHPHRALFQIRALGLQAGIALNPGTPAEACSELVESLDYVIVMSVNPGYAGQAFLPGVLPKVGRVRALLAGGPAWVGVDGGISVETAGAAAAAGADVLIAASAVFAAPGGIEAALARLRAAARP